MVASREHKLIHLPYANMTNGAFDWFDIGSILLSAALAYAFLLRLSHNFWGCA
jgi:hypothetical protein